MPGTKPAIYSIYEDNAAVSKAIDAFVIRLAENVDRLQDLHSEAELDELGSLAHELGKQAHELGFPSLVESCSAIVRVSKQRETEQVESALIELTGISHRIRLGHRGSA
jgi:HPt (histidine-containing phosphotransfer) domain-containing protein